MKRLCNAMIVFTLAVAWPLHAAISMLDIYHPTQVPENLRMPNGFRAGIPAPKLNGISADGLQVLFSSKDNTLVSGDNNFISGYGVDQAEDVFVYEQPSGSLKRISVSNQGLESNSLSIGGQISPNGRFLSFSGDAEFRVDTATSLNKKSLLLYN